MVRSFALCPDGAKQDPVVYVAEFGVVFLAEGPRTASIQEGLDCLGLCHSDLEGEHYCTLTLNRHAGTQNKAKQKQCSSAYLNKLKIMYDKSAIEPLNNRGL